MSIIVLLIIRFISVAFIKYIYGFTKIWLIDDSLGTRWNVLKQRVLKIYKPVSYTHLDVYKRQIVL